MTSHDGRDKPRMEMQIGIQSKDHAADIVRLSASPNSTGQIPSDIIRPGLSAPGLGAAFRARFPFFFYATLD